MQIKSARRLCERDKGAPVNAASRDAARTVRVPRVSSTLAPVYQAWDSRVGRRRSTAAEAVDGDDPCAVEGGDHGGRREGRVYLIRTYAVSYRDRMRSAVMRKHTMTALSVLARTLHAMSSVMES